jgi:DNA mismatch repair ATPase MutL
MRLSLSSEEVQRMQELIERCSEVGVEAKIIGPKQLCLDAIPQWLEERDAPLFFEALKEDLWRGLTIQETIHRFCQTARKLFTLEEAKLLWQSGYGREVSLEASDLERIFLRKSP